MVGRGWLKKAVFLITPLLLFTSWAIKGEAQGAPGGPPGPEAPGPFAIEDCLRMALDNNPQIRKAAYRVEEAKARLREAKASFGPEIALNPRFFPLGGFISLVQSIFTGRQRRGILIDQAQQALQVAERDYERVKNGILYEVIEGYLKLLRLQSEERSLQKGVQFHEARLNLIKTLYQQGALLRQDVLEAEGRLASAEGELKKLVDQQSVARAALNGAMGREPKAYLEVLPMTAQMGRLPDLKEAILSAKEDRPDLREIKARIAEAKVRQGLARTQSPRVGLQATYGVGGEGDFLEGIGVYSRISMPFFGRRLERARSDRLQAELRQLEMEEARLISNAEVEVRGTYSGFLQAQKEAAVQAKQAERAQEGLRLAKASEKWAAGDVLSTIEAQVRYSQAERRVLSCQYELQMAYVRLQRSIGTPAQEIKFEVGPPESLQLSLAHGGANPAPAFHRRALWVWRPFFLGKDEETDFFLSFCGARDIQSIFLFTGKEELVDNPEAFRSFITQAHNQGVKVHALSGEPQWVLPEDRDKAVGYVKAFLAYNQKSPKEARFDALHLDVEPHLLPGWDEGYREEIASLYVDLLLEIASRSRAVLLQAEELEQEPTLAVDIPYWYDKIEVRQSQGARPLSQHIIDLADQVVVMDYTNKAEGIIENVQEELTYAERAGKTIWLGLKTNRGGSKGSSFWEKGESALEEAMEEVAEALNSHRSLQGFALHHYESYQELILRSAIRPVEEGK